MLSKVIPLLKKFVVRDGNNLVARFALIHDHRLADYIQVSFFEAQKGLGDIFAADKKGNYHPFSWLFKSSGGFKRTFKLWRRHFIEPI